MFWLTSVEKNRISSLEINIQYKLVAIPPGNSHRRLGYSRTLAGFVAPRQQIRQGGLYLIQQGHE